MDDDEQSQVIPDTPPVTSEDGSSEDEYDPEHAFRGAVRAHIEMAGFPQVKAWFHLEQLAYAARVEAAKELKEKADLKAKKAKKSKDKSSKTK